VTPDDGSVIDRANLTIVIDNGAATKGISDTNAVDAEKDIKSVSIFVFGAGTASEADTTLLKGSTDFTEDGNNQYKATIKAVPVGSKSVYVGINLPTALYTAIKTKGVAAIQDYKANLNDLNSSTNGFAMFSDAVAPKTIKQNDPNDVPVSVKRIHAKATVETTGDFEDASAAKRTASDAIFDAKLTFSVGQKNTKFYALPQKNGSDFIDPNYYAKIITGNPDKLDYQDDFVNDFAELTGDWNKNDVSFAAYKEATISSEASSIDKHQAIYVLENTNALRKKGELTYINVKATFKPKNTHSYTKATGVTATPFTGNVPNKLYVVNNGGTFYYFTVETEAEAYKNDTGLVPTVYHDGICFYTVFLNPAKTKNVLRNEYYKVAIDEISKIGNNIPGVTDPTDEFDGKADLKVTITVQPWNLIDQPVILGKD
jgi:hypothetical protein